MIDMNKRYAFHTVDGWIIGRVTELDKQWIRLKEANYIYPRNMKDILNIVRTGETERESMDRINEIVINPFHVAHVILFPHSCLRIVGENEKGQDV